MRTSLPEIRRTAPQAGPKHEISGQKPVSRLPSRSGRHRGAAECVDQTFLKSFKINCLVGIARVISHI